MRVVMLAAAAVLMAACDVTEPDADASWREAVPDGATPQGACMDMLTADQQMADRCGLDEPTWGCEGVLGIGSYSYEIGRAHV